MSRGTTIVRRLETLERTAAERERDRAVAKATSVQRLQADLVGLSNRLIESGDIAHNPAASPRENVARAMARGDVDAARSILNAALARLKGQSRCG